MMSLRSRRGRLSGSRKNGKGKRGFPIRLKGLLDSYPPVGPSSLLGHGVHGEGGDEGYDEVVVEGFIKETDGEDFPGHGKGGPEEGHLEGDKIKSAYGCNNDGKHSTFQVLYGIEWIFEFAKVGSNQR